MENYKEQYLRMLKWNRTDYVVVLVWIFINMIILYSDIGWWKLLSVPMIVIVIVLIKKIIENEEEIVHLKWKI